MKGPGIRERDIVTEYQTRPFFNSMARPLNFLLSHLRDSEGSLSFDRLALFFVYLFDVVLLLILICYHICKS